MEWTSFAVKNNLKLFSKFSQKVYWSRSSMVVPLIMHEGNIIVFLFSFSSYISLHLFNTDSSAVERLIDSCLSTIWVGFHVVFHGVLFCLVCCLIFWLCARSILCDVVSSNCLRRRFPIVAESPCFVFHDMTSYNAVSISVVQRSHLVVKMFARVFPSYIMTDQIHVLWMRDLQLDVWPSR